MSCAVTEPLANPARTVGTSAGVRPNDEGEIMKKIASVVEVDGEGLESLLGETVMVWSLNYIYSGVLAGVSDAELLLDEAKVVYETGPFNGSLQDAQPLRHQARVQRRCVEMVTVL